MRITFAAFFMMLSFGCGSGNTNAKAPGTGDGGGSSSGGPPPVVTPCPTDAGTAKVGVWENISPPPFVNPSNMETIVVGVNPHDESVFAAAGNVTNGGNPPAGTGIYKSTDCGATWNLVSTGRSSSNLASGDVWSLRIDSKSPQTMYAANGYGNNPTVYKTTNGGVDWDPLSPDTDNSLMSHNNFVQALAMDPAQPLHLAVTFHENCSSPYNSLCMSETDDGGMNWHEFSGPMQVNGWQEAATITIVGPTSYLYTCASNGAWFTPDTGKTWMQVLTNPIMANYGNGGYLAPDGTLYLGVTGTGIFSSKGSTIGSSWTLIPNSPQASTLISDGISLYASYAWDYGGQPFYSAPLGAISMWTHMQSPTVGRGGSMVDYDAGHFLIYSANLGAGLWRLKTH